MAKPEKETYNVTVLNRRDVSVFPKIGQEVKQVMVTYIAAGLPPATVNIEKKKYTPELEKRLIRADIEKRLKEKPESYTV